MRLHKISTPQARRMRLRYLTTEGGFVRIQFVDPRENRFFEVCAQARATHVRHHLTLGLTPTFLREVPVDAKKSKPSQAATVAARRRSAARRARRLVAGPSGKSRP